MNSTRVLAVGPNAQKRNRRCAGPSNRSLQRLTLLTLLLMSCCLPSAHGQISASIKGIVTDPSGAPVPSATVKTKNLETGAIRSGVTDDAGRYLVLSLPVGEYEVTVIKPGFQDAIRSGIQLVFGEEAHINLRWEAGATQCEFNVTEDAPIVST